MANIRLIFGYMFEPKFIIRPRLLRTIREIGETLGMIRASNLSDARLARLTHTARALSAHASTSIEGNPLPLTDVKRLLKQAPAQTRDTEREVLNYNRALEWVQARCFTSPFSAFRRLQW